jgi:hypothetical protein
MPGRIRRFTFALVPLALAGAIACGDASPDPVEPPEPQVGSLELVMSTTGADPDPDGYLARADTGTAVRILPGGTLTVPGLAPGAHQVTLTDVADNCSLAGDNPRAVTVVAGTVTSVTLQVACSTRFDGSAVDLQGSWVVSEITQPFGGSAWGHTNECRATIPFTVTSTQVEGLWSALQDVGGTITCEIDGVWGGIGTLTERFSFDVYKTGNDVHWVLSSRFSYYLGTLTSADEMSGSIDGSGYGREGTWSARRP